jgi:hypothetical protein
MIFAPVTENQPPRPPRKQVNRHLTTHHRSTSFSTMKKVIFLFCAFAAFQSLRAQGTKAGPPAADIAVHSISFEKIGETPGLIYNTVHIEVIATGTLKNIGNKTYFTIPNGSQYTLAVEENVKSIYSGVSGCGGTLLQMAPGESRNFTLQFTYVKGKPKPVVYFLFKHKPEEFEQGKYEANDVMKKVVPF